MADILASVSVVLGAEVSGFKAAMADARRELRGLVQFAEGLKSVGESLTKYVTLPIVAVGGAAVKLAGDMEVAKVAFTTMLGSAEAATQTLNELKQFAADTPFEFPEIQEAAKKLLAFNTPAKDLKETLRQLGDISAGIGAPIGEIADLFGKARVQGRLFQEDINQLTGRGIPIIQELAKQFGVTDGEVRKLVESGKVNFGNLQKAFADLTKEGGKFGGLMAAQSQTLPGLFSTLTDNVGQSLAGLGATIIEALDLKSVLKSVADFVKTAADAFAALSPEAKKFIVIAAGIAAAIGPVLVAVGALGAALPAITAGFSLLGITSVAALGPVGLAAAALAAAAVLVYENWERVGPVFSELGQTLATAANLIGQAFNQVGDAIAALGLGSLRSIGVLQVAGKIITDLLVLPFRLLGGAIDVVVGTIRGFAGLLTGNFGTAVAGATQVLDGLKFALFNIRKEAVSTGAEFRSFFKELLTPIPSPDYFGDLEESTPKVVALTKEQTSALANLRRALLDNANASRALGELYDFAGGKSNVLTAGIKNLTDAGFAPGGQVVQAYVKQLRAIPVALEEISGRVAKGVENLFKAPEFKLPTADFKTALPEKLQPVDTTAFVSSLAPVTKAMRDAQRVGEELSTGLSETLTQGLTNAAIAFAGAVGQIAAGSAGIEALPQALLGALGGLAVQVGELAIATGIAVLGIKAALQSLNPVLAIAGGIALVALGTAVSSAASSIGSSGGSGGGGGGSFASPNYGSRANAASTTQQTIRVEVTGTLRAANGALTAALETDRYRKLRTS